MQTAVLFIRKLPIQPTPIGVDRPIKVGILRTRCKLWSGPDSLQACKPGDGSQEHAQADVYQATYSIRRSAVKVALPVAPLRILRKQPTFSGVSSFRGALRGARTTKQPSSMFATCPCTSLHP